MTTYLVASFLTGLIGAAYALFAYGTGIWATLGWYLIGGYSGFGGTLAMVFGLAMLKKRLGGEAEAPES